jgi:peptidyl-prolyl cis-trans isomerase SurA
VELASSRTGVGALPGERIPGASRIQFESAEIANMTMTTPLFQRLSVLILACAATLVLIGSSVPLHAQSVAVMVNGEPITNYDIEQRSKLIMLSSHKMPPRQEVIDVLIDEKVKIKEAKQFGIDPSTSDIDASFGQMASRMHLSVEQLTKYLETQGVRPDTLKQRTRAEMVWASLVRGRYKESLQVGEKEVAAAVQVKDGGKDEKPEAESFEYKMQPIVLIVQKGSPPTVVEARRKEAEALRTRVQTCDEANSFFKAMQNAAIREAVTKTSADIPAPLREILDKTPIGHLTEPEVTKQGVEMVALCGRKPTTVDTPEKKEIRDKMFAEKFEAKSKAYLAQIRRAAMIEYR